MNVVLEWLVGLWDVAIQIWIDGAWCMPPLAFLAFITFALGIHINLRLSAKRYRDVPEGLWKRWIEVPSRREGAIGEHPGVAPAEDHLLEVGAPLDLGEGRLPRLEPARRLVVGVVPWGRFVIPRVRENIFDVDQLVQAERAVRAPSAGSGPRRAHCRPGATGHR